MLYGGRGRLLTVREVADQLGVCTATVYRLSEIGDLPHVRITASIPNQARGLGGIRGGHANAQDGRPTGRRKGRS
jgi:hypothetical protein